MQTLYQNEDERKDDRRVDSMDFVICIGNVSRCVKGEHFGRFRSRGIGIYNSGRIFSRNKKRIQR